MLYKHNKRLLVRIKKNPQDDPKVLSSLSLAIIWRQLLYRQSFSNRLTKNIEKQNTTVNRRQVEVNHSLFLPVR